MVGASGRPDPHCQNSPPTPNDVLEGRHAPTASPMMDVIHPNQLFLQAFFLSTLSRFLGDMLY